MSDSSRASDRGSCQGPTSSTIEMFIETISREANKTPPGILQTCTHAAKTKVQRYCSSNGYIQTSSRENKTKQKQKIAVWFKIAVAALPHLAWSPPVRSHLSLCLSTTLVCCGAERDFVSFALKRFRSAAIIFENLCTFPSASHTTGKKREKPRNENKLLISPEHVQPVQGDISTNIPGKGGTRETVPHLK
jgi:hypothetical protein